MRLTQGYIRQSAFPSPLYSPLMITLPARRSSMILAPILGSKTTQFCPSTPTFISEKQYLRRWELTNVFASFLNIVKIQLWIEINLNLQVLLLIVISTMEVQLDQIEQLYNRIPQQVIAELATPLEEYQLPHQNLELSSDLDEDALNQLLKDLLEREDLPRFEFIVEGYILRGKLKSHILRYELSPEQSLHIQYITAFPQLQPTKNSPTNEWISSISVIQGPDGPSAIATSLYDGTIALFSPTLKKIGEFTADQDPLKSCTFVPAESQNHYYCLSGGLGETLQIHLVDLSKTKGIESTLISSNKHEGSIFDLAVSPGSDNHVATGGSDGSLHIWQIPSNFEKAGSHNSVKSKKKKIELDLNVLPQLAKETVHKGTIECLSWINNQEVVSASSAHEIVITDIVRMARAQTILTRDSVVTSLDTNGWEVISAHEDGQLRMWDRRDPTRPTNTFKAHSKWASSVRLSQRSHIFVSGSYDRTVKIWDNRCGFPIQNLQSHQEKVLCTEWMSEQSLLSGGSDSSLQLYLAN